MNHFELLYELLDRAQAPYSGFSVAAIVVTKDGNTYKGVNV